MKLADELFLHYVPKKDALLAYGFTETKDGFSCKKAIRGGEFDLWLTVRGNALVAKLLDAEFGDEYRRIDAEEEVGGFVAEVRGACEALLIDLRDRCFEKRRFISDQANRISALIEKDYGVLPEFLWKHWPEYAVFRNRDTEKWFGIILNINRKKLIPDGDGMVEVINLKLDDFAGEAIRKNGVFGSYHMAKKNWVSVVLDETLADDEIAKLLKISFANSNVKKKK